MADNLESYFKKHLSGDSPGEDNWNVPSDDVWDKVSPIIQKKRGIFIPWRYFYIIGILLISLGLFFWFWNKSEESSQNSELLPSDQSEIVNNGGDQTPTNQIEQPALATEPGINSAKTYPEETDNSGRENTALAANVLNESSNGNILMIEQSDRRDDPQIGMIGSVYPDGISLEESNIDNEVGVPENEYKTIANSREPIDNKGRFAVGAFFAPTWTSTFTKGDPTNGQIETSKMFLYSNNWGFELKYFISNRFTFVTGVEKSEIRSWSKSAMDFDYDTSTEHIMGSGEKENTSHVPMPTPFGKIDTELTYRFPGEDEIPDGEPMLSAFETHQELRYLSIPIGVEFNIIRASRFSWFVEGGLRYNRALRDATTFTSRVLHEGHDMDVVGEEMMSHPTYTENYMNFYLGTGVNYQFSRKLQISASGRYFGSITKVNLQDNLSTYVNGFNLKVGLIYIF